MADLEYTIKTSGGDEAKKSLDQMSAAIREAAKAAEQNKAVNKDAAEKERANAEATGELTKQKKELILQFKELRHEVPFLSEAIHLLKHPVVALGVAIATVISLLKDYSRQVQEAAEAVAPFENVTRSFVNFRAIAMAAKIEAAGFAAELKKISDNADTAEGRFNKLNAALDRQITNHEALRKKLVELAKAQLALAEAEGKISPAAAAKLRSGLDLSSSKDERAAGINKLAGQHGAKAQEIAGLEGEKTIAEQALTGTKAERDAMKARTDATVGLADETIKHANGEIEKIKGKSETEAAIAYDPLGNEYFVTQSTGVKEQREQLQKNIKDAEAMKLNATGSQGLMDASVKALESKILELSQKLQDARRELEDLGTQTREAYQQDKKLRPVEAGIGRASLGTSLLGNVGSMADKAIGEQAQIQAGVRSGTDTSSLISAYVGEIRNLREALKQLAELGIGVSRETAEKIYRLNIDLDAIRRQVHNVQ